MTSADTFCPALSSFSIHEAITLAYALWNPSIRSFVTCCGSALAAASIHARSRKQLAFERLGRRYWPYSNIRAHEDRTTSEIPFCVSFSSSHPAAVKTSASDTDASDNERS